MMGIVARDLIEAEAIAKTFGKSWEEHNPVIIGSIKINVGYIKPVSNITAIIKITFALKNRIILLNLNFKIPNLEINL